MKCPRKIKNLNSPCELGLKQIMNPDEEICQWACADATSFYCVIHLIINKGAQSQKEVARLLNIKIEQVRAIEKQALDKIKEQPEALALLAEIASRIDPPSENDDIYTSCPEDDEKGMFSRVLGASGFNVEHEGSSRPQIYGLSDKWYKNYDRKKAKSGNAKKRSSKDSK